MLWKTITCYPFKLINLVNESPFTAADANPADRQEEHDCHQTRDGDIQHAPICRDETEDELSIIHESRMILYSLFHLHRSPSEISVYNFALQKARTDWICPIRQTDGDSCTAVALAVVEEAANGVLHPERVTRTALCNGVTLATSRTEQ